MRRAVLLWVALWSVSIVEVGNGASAKRVVPADTTAAQTDAAIQRLPAAYRDAAQTSLHLSADDFASAAKKGDAEWADYAITLLFLTPAGRTFLMKRLEEEPDGALRVSILKQAGSAAQYGPFFPGTGASLTAAEIETVRKHAAADPDPNAVVEALKAVQYTHRADERSLLEARRKLADASVLSELSWNRYAWYGEIRNPLYNYNPPPAFSVAPPDAPLRVLVFGDFGTGSEGQGRDAAAMLAYHKHHPFNFGLTLGDNFYGRGLDSPDNPRWQSQWEQLYGPLGIKFYPVYGNHDYGDPDSPAAELGYSAKSKSWVFPAAYYTFTAGAAQFFAIDTVRLTDAEIAWLDSELGKSTAQWKIVYGHYHIYSATRGDNDDKEDNLVGRLLPVLEKNRVQIYLNGHDHNMQEARTQSTVHFFTSGAGGAGLYDMKPTYKSSIFEDKQFGFTVVELDSAHVDVIFIDMDGKEVYRSHIAARAQ